MEMQWYTAYTEPNLEKKVTSTLSRKKIIHFCPMDMIANQEGKKVNQSFSGYVFIKMPETQVGQIKQIKGIKHLLYWMDKPAVVSEFEISLIKSFLSEHSYVKIEKKEAAFTSALYNNGAQKENEAKLIHLNDNKIKAALPSLKLIMIAEFEKSFVQLASNKNIITDLNPKLKYKVAGNI